MKKLTSKKEFGKKFCGQFNDFNDKARPSD
ncbi:MAG: hypothetical protein BWY48_00488 [Parcubacteria group bacterium ADurb.Bin305]|jgi:hypothetical protein|nr:MAG: hypothetical protein BWY48_00488 [Parcubacteria group bacterium ADurb.Bin305]